MIFHDYSGFFKFLAQGPQRSDAGEARTRGPSVSSQALLSLSHCASYPQGSVGEGWDMEVREEKKGPGDKNSTCPLIITSEI